MEYTYQPGQEIFLRQEIFTPQVVSLPSFLQHDEKPAGSLFSVSFIFHKNLRKSRFLEIFHIEKLSASEFISLIPSKIINSKNSIHALSARKEEVSAREQTSAIINSWVNERSLFIVHSIPHVSSTLSYDFPFPRIIIQSVLEDTTTYYCASSRFT